MAGLLFFVIFHEIALRIPIFKDKNDLPADLEILARQVAVTVKGAHSLFRALVLLPADRKLPGHPGGQTVAVLHFPSLASPLDIMLVMIGKELLLDIENELLQSMHAIGAPFRAYNDVQLGA